MSGPCGQAPTFADYLHWMRNNSNYSNRNGIVKPNHNFVTIIDADGDDVLVLFIDQREEMSPALIWQVDHWLGLNSRFRKNPTIS
jgi:hypothetical protein